MLHRETKLLQGIRWLAWRGEWRLPVRMEPASLQESDEPANVLLPAALTSPPPPLPRPLPLIDQRNNCNFQLTRLRILQVLYRRQQQQEWRAIKRSLSLLLLLLAAQGQKRELPSSPGLAWPGLGQGRSLAMSSRDPGLQRPAHLWCTRQRLSCPQAAACMQPHRRWRRLLTGLVPGQTKCWAPQQQQQQGQALTLLLRGMLSSWRRKRGRLGQGVGCRVWSV